MSIICPTILASEAHAYREQMERIESFARLDLPKIPAYSELSESSITSFSAVNVPKGTSPSHKRTSESILDSSGESEVLRKSSLRIQIDLKDGEFALGECVNLAQVWWPKDIISDLHLMYKNPDKHLAQIAKLKPSLVIVHAESNCDIPKFAACLREQGIKTGLAVLQDTQIIDVEYLLPHVQHLLIFSGDLGKFGGQADLSLINKITQAKSKHKYLEVGWDGGINIDNCKQLAEAGVDVLNVGGAIQNAIKPQEAYATMSSEVITDDKKTNN